MLPSDIFVSLRYSSYCHGVFLLVCRNQAIPEAIQVLDIIMVELLLGVTRQRVHGFTSWTCLASLVVSKDLSPSFLNDQHPDLHSFAILGKLWLREGPIFSLSVIWEVVVDNYGPSFSVNVHLHGVAPCFIYFMSQENLLDPVRILGDGAQRCKEVTVT